MKFISWMNGTWGRLLRVVAGLALIVGGLVAGGTGGLILAVVGLLPVITGVAGICILAPLMGVSSRTR